MIEAWTPDQIRAAERPLLDDGQGPELMARAAAGLAVGIIRELKRVTRRIYGARLVVLAGSGNNGGDALFAAATVAQRGVMTTAVLTSERVHTEALAAFTRAGGRVIRLDSAAAVGASALADAVRAAAGVCAAADALVDGIVGTGAAGGLRGPARELVQTLLDSGDGYGRRPLVVACDLPSGVNAETGQVDGPVLPADLTVTFGGAKAGLFLDPAAALAGRIETVDLGLGRLLPDAGLLRLEAQDLAMLWPVPRRTDHKYTRGVLGVAAGSASYPGAALLATKAAAATGVGMIRYLGPSEVCRLINLQTPEAVCSRGAVADARVQAWLVGPGTDGDEEQRRRARDAIASGLPVVADAGAFEALPAELGPHVVLTPHAGELVRILEAQGVATDREHIEASPAEFAALTAGLTGATVLLKGAVTVIAAPNGFLFCQDDGPDWLATAGSGDTLAGILGALAATVRTEQLDAAGFAKPVRWAVVAAMAACLHGLAGAEAARRGEAASAPEPGAPGAASGRCAPPSLSERGRPLAASDISAAVPVVVGRIIAGRNQ
ncbi:bifunctional ADP-dependent NAD(P)H-hydrate dehydratase/NAD(P)H-hydrate epimerase [Arthrobacter sulfonylureivorans]|uniref:Bifunctional NAD(P)H-hydrate repair enzyme n=1 Tax=Arthrobacter sulfonylureivorans TaxID=2486855 RepID=A0ABY3WE53_9MICC|nr:bifunctional ADP-dependent NAD(P)H-hydrate dehydratase/NAD(P)H-hydrate epimerase [Arthrobacter sulfonylureivorans]UNK46838.1 bifunctional ADP-dependent NAD(P)H-hydrate dehydratase/NAD(P)H-hydrate epimerase [Arthrobacter sulfonylureivorans]